VAPLKGVDKLVANHPRLLIQTMKELEYQVVIAPYTLGLSNPKPLGSKGNIIIYHSRSAGLRLYFELIR